jgi:hypothetical protein
MRSSLTCLSFLLSFPIFPLLLLLLYQYLNSYFTPWVIIYHYCSLFCPQIVPNFEAPSSLALISFWHTTVIGTHKMFLTCLHLSCCRPGISHFAEDPWLLIWALGLYNATKRSLLLGPFKSRRHMLTYPYPF